MRTLGNILWFIFGGVLGGLAWIFAGCIWCITIIGIPVGLQCFKFASLAFWPFGKEIVYENGMFSFLVNLIWILFFGQEMALGNLIIGFLWCITIVGIPFGKQFFKMARLSFMPFGASMIGQSNKTDQMEKQEAPLSRYLFFCAPCGARFEWVKVPNPPQQTA